jgi:type IV pilus assembly protein PilN
MDALVYTLPDGVYLDRITQKANSLMLTGTAQSNARVSAYMRNIDGSDWMGNPKLDVIKTKGADQRRSAEFILRANQVTPSTDSEEDQG